VIVPVRDVLVVLAATEYPTDPLPDPLAPLVTVSHEVLLLTAVQEQPAALAIAAEPVVAAEDTNTLVGVNV
jgi:hypothetical protein